MTSVYFNDNEPYVAQWLRNLYPYSFVDERSISDITPSVFEGYERVHLFAGIGGWQYALDLAGWTGPVWIGSCPCQPFSTAGKRKGVADDRHLWPQFRRLIDQCRPPVVFGEQVASKDGRAWLAGVRTDLEALGYAVGAADLCAASCGAPHIRQRLYWVAYTRRFADERWRELRVISGEAGEAEATLQERQWGRDALADSSTVGRLANTTDLRRSGWWDTEAATLQGHSAQRAGEHARPIEAGELQGRLEGHSRAGGLAYTERNRLNRGGYSGPRGWTEPTDGSDTRGLGDTNGTEASRLRPISLQVEPQQEAGRRSDASPWVRYELIGCADGKTRRFEPGSFPLAHGVPARVGRIRAYGNAIVPQVAAQFIAAFMEVTR